MSTKNHGIKRVGFSRHGLTALNQYNWFERSPDAGLMATTNAVSKHIVCQLLFIK